MSAIEAALVVVQQMDRKLDNVGAGIRVSNECNINLVRAVGEIRAVKNMPESLGLNVSGEAAERWVKEQDELDGSKA